MKVFHLQDFTINFGRLKPGKHVFDFQVDDTFFAHFQLDSMLNCRSQTRLTIDKPKANLMDWNFAIAGRSDFPCDRCNDVLSYPIGGNYEVIVKLEDGASQDEDDIIFLPSDSYEYNIAQLVYDFHLLSVPFKKECLRQDHPSCLEANRILNGGSGNQNGNGLDPRWNELRKLL
ncbi:MAG: DUF177 domain-containing protein [Bacteroidetes bacterium]|nr:DUF177 domain-containing protein [Bacteroidota bacterium]